MNVGNTCHKPLPLALHDAKTMVQYLQLRNTSIFCEKIPELEKMKEAVLTLLAERKLTAPVERAKKVLLL